MFQDYHWLNKFQISKGKWVYIQSEKSKACAVSYIKQLKEKWSPPKFYYHFRKGGHILALRKHLKNQYFACVDIENFFQSITKNRLLRTLKKYFSFNDANKFASISVVGVYDNNKVRLSVPYGYMQSIILASLCLNDCKLGKYLEKTNSNEISISVYVDDIILSSNNLQLLNKKFDELQEIAKKSNFKLNNNKIQKPQKKIKVFNIETSNNSIHIIPEKMDYFHEKYINSSSEKQKKGIYNYIRSINIDQLRYFEI